MDKKIYKILFFAALLFFAIGKGQPVANGPSAIKQEPDSAMQAYLRQEHRFEFRNYQMYYNGQLIKADSLSTVYKIFGRAQHEGEVFAYTDKPLSLNVLYRAETNPQGKALFEYEGKKYPFSDANGIIEKNWELYEKGGKKLYLKDKDGIYKGIVDHYTIQIAAFTSSSFRIKDSIATKLRQIPGLNGYILVNGVLVDKNTKPQELRNKLGNIKNGSLSMMMGMPVLTYSPEPGHSFTEYDSKKDPGDDYIRIDFEYEKDRKTGEFQELKFITYYYSIKQ